MAAMPYHVSTGHYLGDRVRSASMARGAPVDLAST